MVPPQRDPLFTLHAIYADTSIKPDTLAVDHDFLEAFENAAVDRGDRSFHIPSGTFSWLGSGWRLKDMLAFIVNVSANERSDLDRAVEWLMKRGYPDQEHVQGWAYDLLFENRVKFTLGSMRPMQRLRHISFNGLHWAVAEKWAINFSKLLSYHTIAGDLDVLADQWT